MECTAPTYQPSYQQAAAPCQATRADLERYLEQSQHGALKNIYDCYFVPNVMPPRCAACHQLIASHGAGGPAMGASNGQPSGGHPEAAVYMGAPVVPPGPALVLQPVELPIVPDPLDPNRDVIQYSTQKVILVIIGIWVVMSVGLFIGFGSVRALSKSGAAFAGPSIILFMAFVFSFVPASTTIVIDKTNRVLNFTQKRLFYPCCCSTERHIPFSSILGITTAITVYKRTVSISLQLVLAADPAFPNGNYIPLQMDVGSVSSSYVAAWQNYFGPLGVALPFMDGGVMPQTQIIMVQSAPPTGATPQGPPPPPQANQQQTMYGQQQQQQPLYGQQQPPYSQPSAV